MDDFKSYKVKKVKRNLEYDEVDERGEKKDLKKKPQWTRFINLLCQISMQQYLTSNELLNFQSLGTSETTLINQTFIYY